MSHSPIVETASGTQAYNPLKAPGHWVLAQAGKRVLRPGGVDLTDVLLGRLNIAKQDTVIELAPGVGHTAAKVLACEPMTYLGVDKEPGVAASLQRRLGRDGIKFVEGCAEDTGLPGETATVLFGEAMLTMHSCERRKQIIGEAWRVLRHKGRYGIHELCICPGLSEAFRRKMEAELSAAIQHGIHLLTPDEWGELMESAGFQVAFRQTSPMRLLAPLRVIQDEGLLGAVRFAFNALTNPDVRGRVLRMRRAFNRYQKELQAIAIVCQKDY